MKKNEPDVHEMWLDEVDGDKQRHQLRSSDYGIARMRVSARNVAEGEPKLSVMSPQNIRRKAAFREDLNKIKAGDADNRYAKTAIRTEYTGQRTCEPDS